MYSPLLALCCKACSKSSGGGAKVDACADWPQIPYAEALLKYGTDKPDLRNPIEMQVVSEAFPRLRFRDFRQAVGK